MELGALRLVHMRRYRYCSGTFVDNGTGCDKTLNNNAITWSVRGRGCIACSR